MDYKQPPTPTLQYFTPIIKNVASTSLEIKKLVYVYLLAHAEAEPQNALMAINAIVRSLSDTNPQVRALALRVMSGIRVPEVSQIVNLYIKRSIGDMSPYVRRAAALAIPKCNRLDPGAKEQLVEYLETLLGDRQYYVVAAAVGVFNEVCPERLDLVHKHYRALVRKMVDMDEWGQLATLKLMTRYARKSFPRRTKKIRRRKDQDVSTSKPATDATKGFYDDIDQPPVEGDGIEEEEVIVDADLELLLRALKPLLNSRNSAVILATARSYLYLAPPPPQSNLIASSIPPLIALLRGPVSERAIALTNIVQICLTYPTPFLPYYTHFLVSHNDEPDTRRLKLEVLTLLFPHASAGLRSMILAELAHFSRSADTTLVRDAVRALGRCAQAAHTSDRATGGATSAKCLRLLLAQLNSPHAALVAESLEVIRHLIQQDPAAHQGTVVQLAKNLDTLTAPQARASIVWLVGEFAGLGSDNSIAPDVLRILVKGFADEDEAVKMQIVLLGAKAYLHWLNAQPESRPENHTDKAINENAASTAHGDDGGWGSEAPPAVNGDAPSETAESKPSEPIPALWAYLMLLVRYDTSYDLRDRARLYKNLLSHPSSTSLASLLLLAPKPVPHVPSPGENKAGYSLGSASLVLGSEAGLGGQGVKGYAPMPDWVAEGQEPDPRLRDEDGLSTGYVAGSNLPASSRLDSVVADKGLGTGTIGKSNGVNKEKTLDDWLAEDDVADESSSEEDTDDESGESEEGSTEEETDEDDEDEDSESDTNEHERLVP